MWPKGAVTNSENIQATPVERARERLEQAFDSLDAAVDSRAQQMASDADTRTSAMDEVNDENARLLKTNETVSKRLDSAIGRLKAVLGG
jgi:hypothetical protein